MFGTINRGSTGEQGILSKINDAQYKESYTIKVTKTFQTVPLQQISRLVNSHSGTFHNLI